MCDNIGKLEMVFVFIICKMWLVMMNGKVS